MVGKKQNCVSTDNNKGAGIPSQIVHNPIIWFINVLYVFRIELCRLFRFFLHRYLPQSVTFWGEMGNYRDLSLRFTEIYLDK